MKQKINGILMLAAVLVLVASFGVSAWRLPIESGLTVGDIIYATGSGELGALTAGASGTILRGAGAGVVPAYSTATYPATIVKGSILYGSSTNIVGSLADVAVNYVLISGGVGADPLYSATPTVTSLTTTGALAGATVTATGKLEGASIVGTPSSQQISAHNATSDSTVTVSGLSTILLTIDDAASNGFVLSESGAVNGQVLRVINMTNANILFTDVAGVMEVAGATMGQYDAVSFVYATDRWIELCLSNN